MLRRVLLHRLGSLTTVLAAFGSALLTRGCDTAGETGLVPVQSSGVATLGARGIAYKRNGKSKVSVSSPPLTTQARGSTILACVGRGDITAHVAPTDNKANKFLQIDRAHAYVPRYPDSGTALYAAESALGGPGHLITAPASSGNPYDETTLAVIEVVNARGVEDFKWNEHLVGESITSLPVSTNGPATLVAFWWGDADGSTAHSATPNNGFTVITSILKPGSLVQCAMAAKEVAVAGSYDVTWSSTPPQGAQLWLTAIGTAG